MHAVQIVQRTLHGVGVIFFQRVELLLPPRIRLKGNEQVRLMFVDQGNQRGCIFIFGQNVGLKNAYLASRVACGRDHHFVREEFCVGNYPPSLIGEAADRDGEERDRNTLVQVKQKQLRCQQQHRTDRNLQARKIQVAYLPLCLARQRQQCR